MAPCDLATTLQSLPPILHRSVQSPIQSYSKGSWGLSVFPRGDCIITNISTSLSLRRRQCGHRYAIRAGRNLPDKEFRYLRTVIVTAAVYWDFNQELAPPSFNLPAPGRRHPIRPLSCLQSAVFLLNSRSHRFFATSLGSPCTGSPTKGTPSSEVTVSICRVPSPEFSQAP